jgi:hypothetical protein
VKPPLYTLPVGTVVRARRPLDQDGANVQVGDVGVVFERASIDEWDRFTQRYGPLVRWLRPVRPRPLANLTIEPAGICNIYEGDVDVIAE